MQEVSAKRIFKDAAAHARKGKDPKTAIPRDGQFVYTRTIVKETDRKTGETRSYNNEYWDSVDGSKLSFEIVRGKPIWQEKLDKGGTKTPIHDWDELQKLPTDPTALIETLSDRPAGRNPGKRSLKDLTESDWQFAYFGLMGLVTGEPVLPEGLRAAAFEALAEVPGVKATAGVTDAKGRPGIGISKKAVGMPKNNMTILDEDDYTYIGTQSVRTRTDGSKTYDQLSYRDKTAIVDKVKQRP